MPNTIHRKDVSSSDFRLLGSFCHAVINLTDNQGRLLYRNLGETALTLPVWRSDEQTKDWVVAAYKTYRKEAVGIITEDFRRICRYIKVKESVLVGLLFRLSMLGLDSVPQTQHRTYRQHFHSQLVGEPMIEPGYGFVLEKRRTLGGFR